MQPAIHRHDVPSGDGDRPTGPQSTGHVRWSSPVSAALEWDVSGGVLTVRLAGDVCTWSVNRMKPVLDALIPALGVHVIGIDLSAVTFLDARGVSMLTDVKARAGQQQRSCSITSVSEVCRRVLTLCEFVLPDERVSR
jgi:anti-anti-sigma factor